LEPAERLDSWKEIAGYIRRDVGTCIKWAKHYNLPVYHIDKNSPRSRVFAFRVEIDQWFKSKTK